MRDMPPPIAGTFPLTRHSMVASLGSQHPDERRGAFEILVQGYWKAVYKYVRLKWRTTGEEAADLTQAFFLRAYEKRYFSEFDPARARFRTFLRVCLDRFVARERQDGARLKRGGGVHFVPLDFEGAERELPDPAAGIDSLDAFFHREWTRTLFALAVDRLRRRCAETGRSTRFLIFQRYDLADDDEARPTYAALAAELRVAVTQVTNELAAARRDFRRFVVEVLREQCATDDEFENEARAWNIK
jgi:RNA polymerase sigma factor (sigma-70 family)